MPSGIYKRTKEMYSERSKKLLGNKYALGMTPWNKGKTGIFSFRKGIKTGKHSWNYIEDRSKLKPDNQSWKDPLNDIWLKSVRNRDGWTCKIKNTDCKGRLETHHILPKRDFPELKYDVNNGITLCQFHHPRKRKDEYELSPYFQKMVAEIK
jgi:hypothetical protein